MAATALTVFLLVAAVLTNPSQQGSEPERRSTIPRCARMYEDAAIHLEGIRRPALPRVS